MKKLLMVLGIFLTIFLINCNAQPKNDYEIKTTAVTGVVKYHFFLEKKTAQPYHLTQGMDYLAPTVITYKVGESASPVYTVNLVNDGFEYRAGIVFENSAGFYGGMGTVTGTVGVVPVTPAMITFTKKP